MVLLRRHVRLSQANPVQLTAQDLVRVANRARSVVGPLARTATAGYCFSADTFLGSDSDAG